jgi:chorismate synthase
MLFHLSLSSGVRSLDALEFLRGGGDRGVTSGGGGRIVIEVKADIADNGIGDTSTDALAVELGSMRLVIASPKGVTGGDRFEVSDELRRCAPPEK